jgi:hypothetical protein
MYAVAAWLDFSRLGQEVDQINTQIEWESHTGTDRSVGNGEILPLDADSLRCSKPTKE